MIRKEDEEITLIRAAYGRSCAVQKKGSVYIWGQGFKSEKIKKPKMIFRDKLGIVDLKFGYKHGLYIQGKTHKVLSWGDKTFGQTGNNMQEGINQSGDLSRNINSNDDVEF